MLWYQETQLIPLSEDPRIQPWFIDSHVNISCVPGGTGFDLSQEGPLEDLETAVYATEAEPCTRMVGYYMAKKAPRIPLTVLPLYPDILQALVLDGLMAREAETEDALLQDYYLEPQKRDPSHACHAQCIHVQLRQCKMGVRAWPGLNSLYPHRGKLTLKPGNWNKGKPMNWNCGPLLGSSGPITKILNPSKIVRVRSQYYLVQGHEPFPENRICSVFPCSKELFSVYDPEGLFISCPEGLDPDSRDRVLVSLTDHLLRQYSAILIPDLTKVSLDQDSAQFHVDLSVRLQELSRTGFPWVKIRIMDPGNSREQCGSCQALVHEPSPDPLFLCPFCGFRASRSLNSSRNLLLKWLTEARARAPVQ